MISSANGKKTAQFMLSSSYTYC